MKVTVKSPGSGGKVSPHNEVPEALVGKGPVGNLQVMGVRKQQDISLSLPPVLSSSAEGQAQIFWVNDQVKNSRGRGR